MDQTVPCNQAPVCRRRRPSHRQPSPRTSPDRRECRCESPPQDLQVEQLGVLPRPRMVTLPWEVHLQRDPEGARSDAVLRLLARCPLWPRIGRALHPGDDTSAEALCWPCMGARVSPRPLRALPAGGGRLGQSGYCHETRSIRSMCPAGDAALRPPQHAGIQSTGAHRPGLRRHHARHPVHPVQEERAQARVCHLPPRPRQDQGQTGKDDRTEACGATAAQARGAQVMGTGGHDQLHHDAQQVSIAICLGAEEPAPICCRCAPQDCVLRTPSPCNGAHLERPGHCRHPLPHLDPRRRQRLDRRRWPALSGKKGCKDGRPADGGGARAPLASGDSGFGAWRCCKAPSHAGEDFGTRTCHSSVHARCF